jgi:hypothetical protein
MEALVSFHERMGVMAAPRKYLEELQERAIEMAVSLRRGSMPAIVRARRRLRQSDRGAGAGGQ